MMSLLKRFFHRRGYVQVKRNGVVVCGDEFETAHMLCACALHMRNKGWDTEALILAIKTLELKTDENA